MKHFPNGSQALCLVSNADLQFFFPQWLERLDGEVGGMENKYLPSGQLIPLFMANICMVPLDQRAFFLSHLIPFSSSIL